VKRSYSPMESATRSARWCAFVLWTALSFPAVLSADDLSWSASEIYEKSVADQVVLDENSKALLLATDVLYEDDGPAAGFSYQPNLESVAGDVWIKKQLIVERPKARTATLLVGRGNDDLRLQLNGQETTLTPAGMAGRYWKAYRFEPTALIKGLNEFVLHAAPDGPQSGRERLQIWIARDDEYARGAEADRTPPNRSLKSVDAGKTWTGNALGDKNDVDGEYYVRLLLEQYVSAGTLTLPVIDAGNLADRPIGPPVNETGPIAVSLECEETDAQEFTISIRTGTTFALQKETWSDWQEYSATNAEVAAPRGRFVQARIDLKTKDPLVTPRLHGIRFKASPMRPTDWTTEWKLAAADNPAVRRSPVPFQYEPFDEPQLKKLREQEQIDDVVKGAKTQFEAACAIAKWSSQRLTNLGHLGQIYPGWNALEILAKHADGTPIGGFCQQYNLLFLQACLSQGLTVRAVSVGPGNMTDRLRSGHETVELWSDDYRKWVYLDGNTGWYIKDAKSGIPLSIWEVRERQLAALAGQSYPAIEMVKLIETRYDWPDLAGGFGFAEMRLIPRNNFLSQKTPLPLNQGMRGWFWPGHWVSADRVDSPAMLYAHRLFRKADAEWTLNHAQIALEATETPGEVRVHLDSETPGWKTYLASWNDETEKEVDSQFVHQLAADKNRLTVVPRNVRGQRGIATYIELIRP
jgi:hypothetical protein